MKTAPRWLTAALVTALVTTASGSPSAAEPTDDAPASADATGPVEGDDPAALVAGDEEEKARQAWRERVARHLDSAAQEQFAAMDMDAIGALVAKSDANDELTASEQQIVAALATVYEDDVAAELDFQTGEVVLGASLATLSLGENMRYLAPADAAKVLYEHWENPPGDAPLGMLFPAGVNPVAKDAWGVVITYSNDGHVEDDDAADIDYDELLEEMQADTRAGNEQRAAAGFGTVDLVGWAEPPHYESDAHVLYWAKELDFSEAPDHTLNYSIRVLGREGVLELNAVARMDQLPMIKPEMEQVRTMVRFNEGHRYDDFDSSTDRVAAYGIGGLVAGKVLAKTGFFAVLLKLLIAGKKLIVVGFLALCAGIGSLVRRRQG